MEVLNDYVNTKYNIHLAELEAEKEAINAQSSAIGATTTKPKAGG